MKDTNKQKNNSKLLTDKDDSSLILSAVPLPAQILAKRRNSRAETTFNNRTVENKEDKDRDRPEGQEQNFKKNENDKDKEFISNYLISPTKTTTNIAPTESLKFRKHWRSPSNPIDFGINCTLNSSPFNKIRFSSAHSCSNTKTRSDANINMNTSEFIKQNNNSNNASEVNTFYNWHNHSFNIIFITFAFIFSILHVLVQ